MTHSGLYSVTFGTPLGTGTGVVVLEENILRGGDSIMYYVGNYALNGDDFTAEVETNVHSRLPGMSSVFGIDRAHISLKGKFSGTGGTLSGFAKEAPNLTFSAQLKKLQ